MNIGSYPRDANCVAGLLAGAAHLINDDLMKHDTVAYLICDVLLSDFSFFSCFVNSVTNTK